MEGWTILIRPMQQFPFQKHITKVLFRLKFLWQHLQQANMQRTLIININQDPNIIVNPFFHLNFYRRQLSVQQQSLPGVNAVNDEHISGPVQQFLHILVRSSKRISVFSVTRRSRSHSLTESALVLTLLM